MNKQPPPFCIQIELTEGCNLACSFCGIAGIRDNGANGPENITGKGSSPYKYLSYMNAKALAKKIKRACEENKWNPRIEMAMHGEPTLNPEYKEIVKLFRLYLPNTPLQMTSNGAGLLRGNLTENINELLTGGLNVLLLDNYERIKICDKVKEKYDGPFSIFEYPLNKKANPHRRRKPDQHDIVIVQDIESASQGNHSTLNNHAGSAFPPNEKGQEKRCAKVFREISIRWDGNVAICCNDWRGNYKCGNALTERSLEELWQNPRFTASRSKLYNGQRDFGPCNGCDAKSYRPGLLPDAKGLEEWPEPTKIDLAHIEKALAGGSYTKAVIRPWEK
jgi:radical SAM protein with 4Fe4S-binding SPASM domain